MAFRSIDVNKATSDRARIDNTIIRLWTRPELKTAIKSIAASRSMGIAGRAN